MDADALITTTIRAEHTLRLFVRDFFYLRLILPSECMSESFDRRGTRLSTRNLRNVSRLSLRCVKLVFVLIRICA